MVHVVRLSVDESSEVQYNPLSFVTLSGQCLSCVVKGSQFLLVAIPFAFEVLCDTLLQDQSFHCRIALSFCSGQFERKTCRLILLLINHACQTASLALVRFNLATKLGKFLVELVDEGLEFEELSFPSFELLLQVVVPFGDL